ncbi:unnamed protein product, partial [Rotaria sp. Silwood2]
NPFLTDDDHHTQTNLPMGPLILQARPATSQTTTSEQNSQIRTARPIPTT